MKMFAYYLQKQKQKEKEERRARTLVPGGARRTITQSSRSAEVNIRTAPLSADSTQSYRTPGGPALGVLLSSHRPSGILFICQTCIFFK